MRQIKYIFVHCTATRPTGTISALRNAWRSQGWIHPGYHYVVLADGQVSQLLPEEYVSNGVRGYNQHAVNVAYMGGLDTDGKPSDTRTPEQKAALRRLLTTLKEKYSEASILGHRSIWGEATPQKWHKMCPCFNAIEEYKNIK